MFQGVKFKPKDLIMIPQMVALALQQDGWWLRSEMPWIKRSAMPESVTDRPATAIEYVYLLSKNQKYFWDAESIRIPHSEHSLKHNPGAVNRTGKDFPKMGATGERNKGYTTGFNPSGRNFRNSDPFFQSWQGLWVEDDAMALIVNPKGFPGAHFATFSEGLVTPLIKAGTSEKGCCPECGEPWVRCIDKEEKDKPYEYKEIGIPGENDNRGRRPGKMGNGLETRTIAWVPGCKCPEHEPAPAVVLDCFSGAGTVGVVAYKLRRDYIGVELQPDYVKMQQARLDKLTEQGRLF